MDLSLMDLDPDVLDQDPALLDPALLDQALALMDPALMDQALPLVDLPPAFMDLALGKAATTAGTGMAVIKGQKDASKWKQSVILIFIYLLAAARSL